MKRLPEAEQEIMLIIWELEPPVTRMDIESRLKSKDVLPNTILKLLSRLDERGFIRTEKSGKINYYYPLVEKEDYLHDAGNSILKNMFGNSLTKFAATMYDGGNISTKELEELRKYIDSKLSDGE
jgi:predicted transcriptional regulator